MPPSLASLKGIRYLDLSQNNLSGSIPTGLQNISVLEYLNFSFPALDGEVPTDGVFKNASAISVVGNYKLCGGISELHLPPCPIKIRSKGKHHHLKLAVIIVCVVPSSIFAIYWWRKQNRTLSSTSSTIDQLPKMSFQSLHSATEGFSANNLIGYGSSGFAYKGNLQLEDKVIAIKVLNLQKKGAHKSFVSECSALENIRHRNLECGQTIVHCDLKPSNILLDDDMIAYVSEFGLAKLLSIQSGNSQKQTSTVVLKETIGYASPVHGIASEVSTKGDVYSFGILVLEMLTGRRPTEEMFKNGYNLHNSARTTYPDSLLDIVDSNLLPKQIMQSTGGRSEEINLENMP